MLGDEVLAGVGPILWGSPLPPAGTQASILGGTVPLECKGSGPGVSKLGAVLVSDGGPVLMLRAGGGKGQLPVPLFLEGPLC